ncbi:MAG: hypothetical protein A2511_14350 [Deltaproteobacteria bacterium RIFOXYD12_FULL_50_9]|nr:MAG: hypothetical protein A2511_14350 [Deltaproteobacteria bacterium RIFOXYD12_FULL_50_9]
MKKNSTISLLILFSITGLLFIPQRSMAMMQFIPFDKIVSKADLAFLGTVVDVKSSYTKKPRMINTEVTFSLDQVIFVRDHSVEKLAGDVVLTFAGGNTTEGRLEVSDVPNFEKGSQYIILAASNGKSYMSPIIGGNQGLFRIVTDAATGALYPVTYNNQIISGVDDSGKIHYGANAKHGVSRGKALEKTASNQDSSVSTAITQPIPGSGALSSSRANSKTLKKALKGEEAETLITLAEFMNQILLMYQNEGGK